MDAELQMLVNIDVDDLDRALAFYRDGLGLHTRRRFGTFGVELGGASASVFLLVKRAGSRPAKTIAQLRDYARHWTPVHLDFIVDDVDAAVARLEAAGATLESPPKNHLWGRIAHLADPFGHGLCLIQFLNRGYDEIADPP